MIEFAEIYSLLVSKAPGKVTSSRGTEYRVEARIGKIIAFPKLGRITIHEDCWTKSITCQGTWAGGIYNGLYSIYDWYKDNV